ncbi:MULTISPECIES: O-methyltransferase [unclassified Gemella]|uniref:O-methyltransferase n=1 Tax=unclassified Gemella TaxID=2624949 RepID=UPI0010739C51|nr:MULTISPECIES: O-methyltransferase [unclassified Gemella]MBF0710754.1 O-methyltransferase [Gemella sp. GL1.1]MBF0746677.1 O-methyltransferase [Gemella sp. 19428wG2_WT2a]NYS28098.1 O-methyltransferase [Gemella sp. GL1]TFU60027.1 O-methyltransferase [Gemella sp. WT2a]
MVAIESKDSLYVENLLPESEDFFKGLEAYALENKVPIIDKIAIAYLIQLFKIKKAKNILEIGTAIAYSSIRLCEEVGAKVTTIERNELMQEQAEKNINLRGLEDRITMVKGDALVLHDEVVKQAPYDVVFIDGAKSQSRKFFELYEPYFADDVLIITDNVLFKGMVSDPSIIQKSKDLRQLARKIDKYNQWIMNHPNYSTSIMPFGDGIAMTIRK